jgi:hypothetical protein
MTIQEMATEQIKDALLNAYRYLGRVQQIQQDAAIMEQELQKRTEKDGKEEKKK